MTHTFSLNFETSRICASRVRGPRQCKKAVPKCYEFFTGDLEDKTAENIPIVALKRRYLPWLFSPATSLSTRSIIYPCTKNKCSLPCVCFICQKSPPTCRVPASEACHCQDCQGHFEDHRLYHAAYHMDCKFCAQLVQAMPQLNFYFLFNSSEKLRNNNISLDGQYSGDEPDSERPGVVLHPGQKMKWNEWRQRYDNWLAGKTDEEEIWCPGCPKLFFSYDLLRKHMITTHTVSKSFRHYYKDVISALPIDFKCHYCGSKFAKSCELQRHVDAVHIKEGIRCEFCNIKFSRWDNYTRHKLRKHDSSDKNVCNTCGMKYDSAEALDKHVGVGPECNSSLNCEKCATTFSTISDLKRHNKSTIMDSCDICGKEVCNGKMLKAHIKSEHKDCIEKLSCNICGQSFTLKKSLKLHVKNRVSISCQDCGKIFCNKRAHNKYSLTVHGKYHSMHL